MRMSAYRWIAVLLAVCVLPVRGAERRGGQRHAVHCQILDRISEPVYQASVGVVAESGVEGFGDSAMVELGAHWEFAYFRDVLDGDIDLNLRVLSTWFTDTAGLHLPNQLGALTVDAGWTQRYLDGQAGLQVRLHPGIYSDFEQLELESFNMPVSVAGVYAFGPYVSAILGVELRPGFDLPWIPIAGVEWDASDALRVSARLPSSKIEYSLDRYWNVYLGFDWNNLTYRRREVAGLKRHEITTEDYRAYAGVTRRLTPEFHVSGELGGVFDRDLTFDHALPGMPKQVDVEDAVFVRFMLGGPF